MSRRRVVITGMGLITPIGNSVETTWDALLQGKSGVASISSFDPSAYTTRISAAIKDFEPTAYMSAKESRKMDGFIQYGVAAAIEAIKDSGLTVCDDNAHRIGVAIGSGIGGIGMIEKYVKVVAESGPRKITPFFIPAVIINMISGHVSTMHGYRGPNISLVSACTTGTHNVGQAFRTIVYDDADVMVAGGSEKGCTPMGLGGFAAARALSTRNDEPQLASRPWDRDRDGFVLGDGAGVLVLEEYEHAKRRNAHIYAEIIGFGMSGDAHHMTMPPENGQGALDSMNNALRDARINPEEVDYINAHGTSTPLNDKTETLAMKRCFGDHAYKLAISSTKSMIGHLLGAAGAVEAIFSALSIYKQVAPPTINLDNPDDGHDLDYVPHTARDMDIKVVLSNSFGFGGTNGSIILRKVD